MLQRGRLRLGQQCADFGDAVFHLPQFTLQERPHRPVVADKDQAHPGPPTQGQETNKDGGGAGMSPAIRMEYDDHRGVTSTGSSAESIKWRADSVR